MHKVREFKDRALLAGPPLRGLVGRMKDARITGFGLEFAVNRHNVEVVYDAIPDLVWEDPHPLLDACRAERPPAKVLEEDGFVFKTRPFPHQLEALIASADKKVYAYFLEMGLGKTKLTIDLAAHLHRIGEIDGVLIVAPNSVHRQWVMDQLPAHLPDTVPAESVVYTSNAATTRRFADAYASMLRTEGLAVLAINVESMFTEKAKDHAKRMLQARRCLFVLDESVTIKNPGSKRTRAMLALAPLAPYRRILTGAPVTNGVENLYSQFAFLDKRIIGASTYAGFKANYCILRPIPGAPYGATEIVGYKDIDNLKLRIEPYTARYRAEDVLGLPERTYMIREVPLTPEQDRMYKALKNILVAEFEGTTITATIALTKLLRLQQITGGFVTDEVTGVVQKLPNNRIAEVVGILEETGEKLVVWARFRAELDALAEALAPYNPAIWGRDDREDEKRRFLSDPSCRVFIGNPQSAGTGLDGLQHVARTMVYYSNSYSANNRWQSEARLHRSGQTGTVNVIDLVSPGTLDKPVLDALQEKKDIANMAVEQLKRILEG